MLTSFAPRKRRTGVTRAALLVMLLCPGLGAWATEFSLTPREPGPGHRMLSYWWIFNHASWELTPPDGFTLTGGSELRLSKTADPGLVAIARETNVTERDLFKGDDKKAQAAYVRKMLPGGITEVKLISQAKNPLPVNGLMNFEVVYSYVLGGQAYRLNYMVSQGGESIEQLPPVPGQPTPPPTPAPTPDANGQPVRTGDFFTTVVGGPLERQPLIYGAFQQMLATAKLKSDKPDPDDSTRYASHGMLGR